MGVGSDRPIVRSLNGPAEAAEARDGGAGTINSKLKLLVAHLFVGGAVGTLRNIAKFWLRQGARPASLPALAFLTLEHTGSVLFCCFGYCCAAVCAVCACADCCSYWLEARFRCC